MISDLKMLRCLVFNAGGSSMSGLVRVLHTKGWVVEAHEWRPNARTRELERAGIRLHYGSQCDLAAHGFELAVYSSVERPDDLKRLFKLDVETAIISQFELIGILTNKSTSIGITGSYGKTITTGLVVSILDAAGITPSFTCGGTIRHLGLNARLENPDFWVIEAVETHANLLHVYPSYSIILNVEESSLIPLFRTYIRQTRTMSILNVDDRWCRCLYDGLSVELPGKLVSVSLENRRADFSTKNLDTSGQSASFQLLQSDTLVCSLSGPVLTSFDPHNLLAAAALAHVIQIPCETINRGFSLYQGIQSRFEIKLQRGSTVVLADIAHHPQSIRSSIALAKQMFGRKVLVLYRPHMFKELNENARETAEALMDADQVILSEVLSFKDGCGDGLDSKQFVNRYRNALGNWNYCESRTAILSKLRAIDLSCTAIIVMGMYLEQEFVDEICQVVSSAYN